jgi:hypothetical protein
MERDGSRRNGEHGQATAEWVALLLLVALLLAGLLAAGLRIPVSTLAGSLATRILCAVSLSEACRAAPQLVAAYGAELAALVRRHAPSLAYEDGMRALPVDFRRCRSSRCGDGPQDGVVTRSLADEPVVAFVHVVDCRRRAAARTERLGGDCSEPRRGNLYLQYWTYYADSATMRGVPVAGGRGYHRDDWEGTQFRIGPDGGVDQRASSHHGYNCEQGAANWGSDAGIGVLTAVSEAVGARPRGGWCTASRWLFVSGGSHAGGVRGDAADVGRITPRGRVLLVPLEPIAREYGRGAAFAVAAPWVKQVWWDPEAEGTS